MSDSVSADLRTGAEIAGYRVEAVLGRVAGGQTLLAVDPAAGRRVVLKLFDLGRADGVALRTRVERIFGQLTDVADESIARVLELRALPDRIVLVREWVDADDLAALLGSRGPLTSSAAFDLVSQVARGLDVARWRHGLVHGHLVPGNILVEPISDPRSVGLVRLVDFGLWPAPRSDPRGAAEYLASEQLAGEDPTSRSDQYSLACIAYECLSGQSPFAGEMRAVSTAHEREAAPLLRDRLPEVPVGVDQAIARALSKQPDERYASCGDFASALASAGSRRGPGPPPSEMPWRPLRRTRVVPFHQSTSAPERGSAQTRIGQGAGVSPERPRVGPARRPVLLAIALVGVVLAIVASLLLIRGSDAPSTSSSEPAPTSAAPISTPDREAAELSWSLAPDANSVLEGAGNQEMRSVTAGGPGLVAVGLDGAKAAVWTSADGIAWSRVSHDEAVFGGERFQQMWSATAGGPGLVAVGQDGPDAAVWVSGNGIVWSRVPHDSAIFGGSGEQEIRDVTRGESGLVAVGLDSSRSGIDAAVWTSADGLVWARVPHVALLGGPGNQEMRSVTATASGFVAVGSDQSDAAVWMSSNGLAWARAPELAILGGPGRQEMRSVTAGGPGLVAVGLDGADAAIWTSPDGLAWATALHEGAAAVLGSTENESGPINSVIVGGPGLVAVGFATGSGAAVWTSVEGLSWSRSPDGAALGARNGQLMSSVTVAGPSLVAIGRDGTDAAVWRATQSPVQSERDVIERTP